MTTRLRCELAEPAAADLGQAAAPMFVIELVYTAALEQIDACMKEHVEFLRKHYAAGTFLVSGRKIPRDGGIILAVGSDRAAMEATVREDPFVAKGLATFRIIEFRASQRADDLQARIERNQGRGRG